MFLSHTDNLRPGWSWRGDSELCITARTVRVESKWKSERKSQRKKEGKKNRSKKQGKIRQDFAYFTFPSL